MAATVAHTKDYFVGPQDGWVLLVDGTTTNYVFVRISAVPHSAQFRVFAGTSAPSATEPGVLICHHPFKVANYFNGSATKIWVKVTNPHSGSTNSDGKIRLDVYADGGVLQ